LRPPPADTVRLGIRTVDYIAWVMRETVEAAKQRFEVLIEQSEAERLLNETGAPRPWQHAALAFGLMMRHGGIEASWRRRAQAAMDELRIVLPKFLPIDLAHTQFFQGIRQALEEFETATGEHLGSEELDRSDLPRRDELLLSTYQSLLELRKLRDLVPRRRTMEWHRSAAELFHYFQAVVHPACGTSADGPAVRFIQQALFYLDRRHQERGAIEQVLRRYRRRFPEGNDPFACPVIPPTEGSSDSDYP
jgi:hypothetical protein